MKRCTYPEPCGSKFCCMTGGEDKLMREVLVLAILAPLAALVAMVLYVIVSTR